MGKKKKQLHFRHRLPNYKQSMRPSLLNFGRFFPKEVTSR